MPGSIRRYAARNSQPGQRAAFAFLSFNPDNPRDVRLLGLIVRSVTTRLAMFATMLVLVILADAIVVVLLREPFAMRMIISVVIMIVVIVLRMVAAGVLPGGLLVFNFQRSGKSLRHELEMPLGPSQSFLRREAATTRPALLRALTAAAMMLTWVRHAGRNTRTRLRQRQPNRQRHVVHQRERGDDGPQARSAANVAQKAFHGTRGLATGRDGLQSAR